MVDTNGRCIGLRKCAFGTGEGFGVLYTGGRCESFFLFFLFVAVSSLSFFAERFSRFCLRSGHPRC
jgi:hypothetical protein